MNKFVAAGLLSAILLSGCGNSDSVVPGPLQSRTNVLRVVDPTPDLTVNGHPVTFGRLSGFDQQGNLVFGPDEELYGPEMVFSGLPDTTRRVEVEFQRGQGFTLARHLEEVDFPADDDGVITLDQVNPQFLSATPEMLTVRVENLSNYDPSKIFVTVLGKDKADSAFYYLQLGANGNNTMQRFGDRSGSDNYSFPLSATVKEEAPGAYSFQCPYDKLVSGRIYLSFGEKLQGLGLADTANPLSLVTPSPTGAPDYQKVFEFMELSATIQDTPGAQYILFANTSVVDFFSVGLGMTLDYHEGGANKSERVGFVENARALVLQAFDSSTVPAEFKSYINSPGSDRIIRVLSPVQTVAVNSTGPTASFLNAAIDAGWTHYSQQVLNLPDTLSTHYGYQYTGQLVNANNLTMTTTATPPGDSASLNEVSSLPKPSTRIVFFCDDDQPPANTPVNSTWQNLGTHGHKRLCSLLSSAINRGVFENYNDWDKPEKFYTRPDGRYNHYSKIMHQFALDQKVYGFGYDDVYGQDPTLSEPIATVNQVVLEIPAFSI
ncbi:MAG: beta-1,3-glucanase family protein [Vulcanimicrobiota bacterium]